MSEIKNRIEIILKEIENYSCQLIAVTKTHPISVLEETYTAGYKIFGENKVQEMTDKYNALPKDIVWHMIGHLQSNKVKYMAPYVSLIHGIDSVSLLSEVNKQAAKANKKLSCLLQVHIAAEESKFGFSYQEIEELLQNEALYSLQNIEIKGFMGMASNTDDTKKVDKEFEQLGNFFRKTQQAYSLQLPQFKELSMGMSGDFKLALAHGSTYIRVGSAIFGAR